MHLSSSPRFSRKWTFLRGETLTEFEKRTKNMKDLLQMNSVVFHHYFTDKILFGESDHILLSMMYLAELAVDAHEG